MRLWWQRWGMVCMLMGWMGAVTTAGAEPWQVELGLDNDLFVNNSVEDDFYTFGTRIGVTYGDLTYRWEELAFTDREAGMRFDETYLVVGGKLPERRTGNWEVWVEGGVAHVGEGLLGQAAQNTVHEWIGDDKVRLDYLDISDYYAHIQVELGRQWRLAEGDGWSWTWGPQAGVSATPGFRWNSLLGLRTFWQASDRVTVDATVGNRFAETEMELLEPQLEDSSLAAQVELGLPWGLFLEWSLNRYGTDREHISFGIRLDRELFRGSAPRGEAEPPPRAGDVP
ncbi:MAG: hypothetical protein SX243_24370 [Acidobacteriota bacterium]|nr:hypothetical protein [Acidobacteriota bacterium]